MRNKGQSWYLDFILGTFVMIIVMIIFVKLVTGFSQGQQEVQVLTDEARMIANTLLSSGYNMDKINTGYVKDSLTRIGLTNNDYKIDKTKLDYLLDVTDYERLKYLLGTNKDFYVYFEKDGAILQLKNGVFGFGKLSNTIQSTKNIDYALSQEKLAFGGVKSNARLTRIIYYDSTPNVDPKGVFVKIVVIIWE